MLKDFVGDVIIISSIKINIKNILGDGGKRTLTISKNIIGRRKMTQGILSVVMDKNVTEQGVLEYCLNLYHQGYRYELILGLYMLVNNWHIEKILHYNKLFMEEK